LPLYYFRRRSSFYFDDGLGSIANGTLRDRFGGVGIDRLMFGDNIRDILAQRDRGSRYSLGYPACPHVPDRLKQLELLGTERMKMTILGRS
jgi:cobalamin-dependent methionine synthase I